MRSSRPRGRLVARAAALALVASVATLLAPTASARGRSGWHADEEHDLNARRHAAIQKGCAWLASKQDQSGFFGEPKAVVATTALGALALMAEGSSPGGEGRGPHGKELKRAIGFLLGAVETKPEHGPDGYFWAQGDINSRMHGQGYATLALASALGSAEGDLATRIRAALGRAVRAAEFSQTGTGGWGYDPTSATEHEGSVTVTVAQGLRAARDAGLLVSRRTIERGLQYLDKSQKHDGDDAGSFKYSLTQERSSYALTAAAVSSYFLFGAYETGTRKADIDAGIEYLKRRVPDVLRSSTADERMGGDDGFFYYGNFYAAWAAWQNDGDKPQWEGDEDAREGGRLRFWGPWHAALYTRLLELQHQSDGHWTDVGSDRERYTFGDCVPTAFAILTLAIPDEMIPIFQR